MKRHNKFKLKGVADHLVEEMNTYNLNTVKDWQDVIQFAQQMQLNINPDITLPFYESRIILTDNGYHSYSLRVLTYAPVLPRMFERITLSAFLKASDDLLKAKIKEVATNELEPWIVYPVRFEDVAEAALKLVKMRLEKMGFEIAPDTNLLPVTPGPSFEVGSHHPSHNRNPILLRLRDGEEPLLTPIHNIRMDGEGNVVFDYV